MYLGLDLGTSGGQGAADRRATQTHRRLRPARALTCRGRIPAGPSRIPADWMRRDRGSGRRARSATHPAELAAVRGIGLSGQMHGATLLDARRPGAAALHPVERRRAAMPRPRELDADPRFREITGNIVFPGLHRAEAGLGARSTSRTIFAQVAKVLLPKDYLRLLADRRAHLGDVGRRPARSGSMSARATGRTSCLPRPASTSADAALVEGTEPAGTLRAGARRALGHRPSVSWSPAAPATMPRRPAASARSRPGAAFVSLGTSGVLFAANAALSAQPGKRGARLLPRAAGHLAPDGRDPVGDRFARTGCPSVTGKAPAS